MGILLYMHFDYLRGNLVATENYIVAMERLSVGDLKSTFNYKLWGLLIVLLCC